MGRLIIPLAVVAVTMIACRGAELSTAPIVADRISVPNGPLLGRDGGRESENDNEDTVRVLKRRTPISRMSFTKVIGPAGGEIVANGTGGRVVFPRGAVLVPTQITMTARAGTDIVYDFQPHMVFPVPVTIRQELDNTTLKGNLSLLKGLLGAYYEGDYEQNYTDGTRKHVRTKEVFPAVLDASGKNITFLVVHFSGYLASSGRSGSSANNEDQ